LAAAIAAPNTLLELVSKFDRRHVVFRVFYRECDDERSQRHASCSSRELLHENSGADDGDSSTDALAQTVRAFQESSRRHMAQSH
jgi:hypothetical protein